MAKFRKKPVIIEAFQMTKEIWNTDDGWPQWALEALDRDPSEGAIWYVDNRIYCGTREGVHEVSLDDWIIQGIAGEIYPCKPDIFEQTYNPEPQTEGA